MKTIEYGINSVIVLFPFCSNFFTYNDEGIRTSKTNNGVKTTYYLSGSQIVAEETSNFYQENTKSLKLRSFMMDYYFYKKTIGGAISSINRLCDMLSIEFTTRDNSMIYLHIQSFFRVKKEEKIIISSEDMYRCYEKNKTDEFNWDIPGASVFDKSLEQYIDLLTCSKVTDIMQAKSGDLNIKLENGLSLEILIDTTVSEEKYRFFDESQEYIV